MIKADFGDFLGKKTVRITEKNNVECSLNLSEENAGKILSLTGRVFQPTCEKEDGAIIYGGLAAFNAVFGGDEPMRIEAGAKFSFKAQLPDENAVVKKTEYRLYGIRIKSEGGMLYALASLQTDIYYTVVSPVRFLSDTDTLNKKGELPVYTDIDFSSAFDLEDEFEEKKIKRVIYSSADVAVKDVSTGINSATVEGEAIISVFMLPFNENGDILKEVRVVPFRFECDADGADEGLAVTADGFVDKLSIKVYVDEEKNSSTVSVNLSLSISGTAVRCDRTEYVEDCYSPVKELTLSRTHLSGEYVMGHHCRVERVSGKLNCAVPEYSRFIRLIGETLETANAFVAEGFLTVDGVITGNALFFDGDNELVSNAFSFPFSASVPTEATTVANVKVVNEEVFAKLRGGRLEAETNLVITYAQTGEYSVEAVTALIEGGEKRACDHAISVYVGVAGDTEWDVTKRLGVSQEEIAALNPDVSFPLSGNEKIIVFRKIG